MPELFMKLHCVQINIEAERLRRGRKRGEEEEKRLAKALTADKQHTEMDCHAKVNFGFQT